MTMLSTNSRNAAHKALGYTSTYKITIFDPAAKKSVSWTSPYLKVIKQHAAAAALKGADVTVKDGLGKIIWAHAGDAASD